MKIVKNINFEQIRIIDDESRDYVDISLKEDSLFFVFSTNKPFIINNNLDEDLYYALSWFMSNDYIIRQPNSFKQDSLLEYLSDSALGDAEHRNRYAKLSIINADDKIFLGCDKKNVSEETPAIVILYYDNLGLLTSNTKTGASLQEDMLYAFDMALYKDQFENEFNKRILSSDSIAQKKRIKKQNTK